MSLLLPGIILHIPSYDDNSKTIYAIIELKKAGKKLSHFAPKKIGLFLLFFLFFFNSTSQTRYVMCSSS